VAVGHAIQAQTVVHEDESLSNTERWRLTCYKWRYTLESDGFDSKEASSLIFLKWLRMTRRLAS
jgi:hypothetical protein